MKKSSADDQKGGCECSHIAFAGNHRKGHSVTKILKGRDNVERKMVLAQFDFVF